MNPDIGLVQKTCLPEQMTVVPNASIQAQTVDSSKANGIVWAQPLFASEVDGENTAFHVTYAPHARSAWHSHPLGQMLFILSGTCEIQRRGGEIETARAGDAVWIAPQEEHWHGATAHGVMVYLSVQAVSDGNATKWLGHSTGES
ncbi:cupin domain-containing protein [Glaciimonas soli]|uniref:Cupin domain-containing protein n=1 Tax=Glaciimonas soli TaxID=2590999 RepID=A0A843YXM2_9BURK|nr:cupin domain-containing protein [Glaciimonas soli]MQR02503.1 cupin domain-containing protein [Glaciimonas soli]